MLPSDLVVKSIELKTIGLETRAASFIASTATMDADGDVIEQSWNLERFKMNPVILFAHDNRALPIGKATAIGVVDGKLEVDVEFASAAANPMAEHVWQSIKEGTLRAVSVGFRPKTIRKERRDDKDVFVLAGNELYEVSVVPIPSNPDAVARMKAALSPPKVEQEKSAIGGEEKDKMELEEKCASLEKTVGALNERCKALETELSEARSKVLAHELASVEKEIDSLIGVKIAPTEKAGLLKLAALDRGLFDEQVKAIGDRPNMTILGKALPADPTPHSLPSAGADDGRGFEKLIG